jgi:hypothetical protein
LAWCVGRSTWPVRAVDVWMGMGLTAACFGLMRLVRSSFPYVVSFRYIRSYPRHIISLSTIEKIKFLPPLPAASAIPLPQHDATRATRPYNLRVHAQTSKPPRTLVHSGQARSQPFEITAGLRGSMIPVPQTPLHGKSCKDAVRNRPRRLTPSTLRGVVAVAVWKNLTRRRFDLYTCVAQNQESRRWRWIQPLARPHITQAATCR